jgi:hypothetical protein
MIRYQPSSRRKWSLPTLLGGNVHIVITNINLNREEKLILLLMRPLESLMVSSKPPNNLMEDNPKP